MIEIWGRRNSSNVIPVMWAVAETGLAYRRHDVGGSFGGLDSPDYRAMNPNGLVPTLTDDGFVVWESIAIIRYIAAKYSAGNLWHADPARRSLADRWMEWAKSIMSSENISDERLDRWGSFMVPYALLPDEVKEHDRVWARKALAILG